LQCSLQQSRPALTVAVSGCISWTGPGTSWSESSFVQYLHYRRPSDSYEVRVADSRCLACPVYIQFKACRKDREDNISKVSAAQPLFTPHWPSDVAVEELALSRSPHMGPLGPGFNADRNTVKVGSILRAWGIAMEARSIPVLAIPFPLAYLVGMQRWDRILVLTRWHRTLRMHIGRKYAHYQGPVADWPPPDAEAHQNSGQHCRQAKTVESPLTSEALNGIAAVLRRATACVAGDESLKRDCESSLRQLSQWSISLSHGGADDDFGPARHHFKSTKLLSAIRLGLAVKGGSGRLVEVVKQSILFAAPVTLRKTLMESLDRPGTIPSGSLIRRYELALDIALQLTAQRRSSLDRVCRYGHADSSPIAGYDWMWSQYVEIRAADVAPTYLAVCQLAVAMQSWAQQLSQVGGGGEEEPTVVPPHSSSASNLAGCLPPDQPAGKSICDLRWSVGFGGRFGFGLATVGGRRRGRSG
jgi:hypothetical protein